jgi:hypothetical protein
LFFSPSGADDLLVGERKQTCQQVNERIPESKNQAVGQTEW